jgi:cytochrome c556
MPAEGEKPADAPVKVESPPTEATPVAEKTAMAVVSDAPEADGWESLIPTTILEEEVKSIRNFLQETVNSVGNYNSSMMMIPPKVATLAALAEVARQQKESVSWKADANYVRDLAGKMNSSPLQRGAKDQKRLQELFESIADILNRSKPAGLEAPPETDSFAETAEMRSLMKRMEEAEKLMKTEIASADALGSRKAMVAHEASVLGVLAKIVTQPGYGYEEDAEFKGYANGIVQATQNLKNASEGGDFSGFEAAMSGIATNCQNCHSKYKND